MRLRNAAVAAFGAFTLLLAVPNSASAAIGEFQYRYGTESVGKFLDPDSETCINIPEADELNPAYRPWNYTDKTATVFAQAECDGDEYYVLNPGKQGEEKIKFRSVVFS
ncbi:hypothetical protein ACIQWN_04650 [Streptomyces vinaceus]|uniref:hypothetical protein n=1 Tax=Streptomyces vinaceus TaxID=1960 RepID=UPI003800539F